MSHRRRLFPSHQEFRHGRRQSSVQHFGLENKKLRMQHKQRAQASSITRNECPLLVPVVLICRTSSPVFMVAQLLDAFLVEDDFDLELNLLRIELIGTSTPKLGFNVQPGLRLRLPPVADPVKVLNFFIGYSRVGINPNREAMTLKSCPTRNIFGDTIRGAVGAVGL